jgi:hypothetical protein
MELTMTGGARTSSILTIASAAAVAATVGTASAAPYSSRNKADATGAAETPYPSRKVQTRHAGTVELAPPDEFYFATGAWLPRIKSGR